MAHSEKIEALIKGLHLQPHPEGGYYREAYRCQTEAEESSLGPGYSGKRSFCTCIYFLLPSGSISAFHKIRQDEIWHFYDGAPLLLHMISPDGSYSAVTIGRDLSNGEVPQFVVPGGNWFAAEVCAPEAFCLMGCTVSPGFDFRDFELAKAEHLSGLFPQHRAIIERLCL